MIKRYQVLSAMLTLRTFTIKDLAEFSGVNPRTVRTILNREQQYVEKLEPEPSDERDAGRRGGRYARYAVNPEQLKRLRRAIEEIRKQLPPVPDKAPPTDVDTRMGGASEAGDRRVEGDESPDLILAEDALLRLFPESVSVEDKRHLITLADYHADAARARIENQLGGDGAGDESPLGLVLRARLRGVEVLRRFSEAELSALTGATDPETDVVRLREEIARVTEELNELGQRDLAMGVARRALRSEVFDRGVIAESVKAVPLFERNAKAARAEAETAVAAAESAELHPILEQVETISRIPDLGLRQRECLAAARVCQARFRPSDHLINSIVQQIFAGAQFRLNRYEVAALAEGPEFYFRKTYRPGRKGLFLDSLRYIQTVFDFRRNGSPVGSVARNLLERV